MTAWLFIGATFATLYAFWIALNWTFDLIEWARRNACSCHKNAIDPWCRVHGTWVSEPSAEDGGKPARGKAS